MNGLPNVDIQVNNDRLGQTAQTEDGIVGLILTGVAVAGDGNISLNTPVQIFSLQEAEDKGILTGGSNEFAHQQIKEFYAQAGDGTELWLMVVASTITLTALADKEGVYAPVLVEGAKGRIRTLGILRNNHADVTILEGMDEDVHNAVPVAQALAEFYADKYQPLRVILDGKDFEPEANDLRDYTAKSYNRVAILVGNASGGLNAAVGLLLGKLAVEPVNRNIARVASGALQTITAFFNDGTAIEEYQNRWNAIHDKGYIFLRSFEQKAGYFFTDDATLTNAGDDFRGLSRIAVIDKARLVGYSVLVEKLNDDIPLEANGKVSPALIKSWQADIDNAINATMTTQGEISGVRSFIDATQDVITSDTVAAKTDILPNGQSKYITVDLGFTTALSTQNA